MGHFTELFCKCNVLNHHLVIYFIEFIQEVYRYTSVYINTVI